MANLSKPALLERFLQAVSSSGWQSLVQPPRQHPFMVNLWSGADAYSVRIYIWNVTPGGPATVRPQGEYRIQITGVSSPMLVTPNTQTLLLGWEDETETFTAYDIQRHRVFGSSPSIQVRLATLQKALETGYAFQRRGNEETIVAFVPDQMINYISQQSQLHSIGRNQFEETALANLLQEEPQNIDGFDQVSPERQTVLTAVSRYARERTFRDRVLRAYGHQCSVCRLQLQLVQAAHIVPVNTPGSNDLTSNGIALCPSDHLAYDRGLLGVSPNYHIIVNNNKLEDLRSQNLNGGEDSILSRVCSTIVVPSQHSERPNPEYLRRGLQIRGWPDNLN